MSKIFQIGFNRCGTLSIHNLFNDDVYPPKKCVHWANGALAMKIRENLILGKKALEGWPDFYEVFTDMEFCDEKTGVFFFAYKCFSILDNQYPGSKFILNTRSRENWIKSRLNHKCDSSPYSDRHLRHYGKQPQYGQSFDLAGLVSVWENDWASHHERVKIYFKDRPRDLLVFDIEKDGLEKFRDFFPDLEFKRDRLGHENKSTNKEPDGNSVKGLGS